MSVRALGFKRRVHAVDGAVDRYRQRGGAGELSFELGDPRIEGSYDSTKALVIAL